MYHFLLEHKTKEVQQKMVHLGTDTKIADEVSSACKKEEIDCTEVKSKIKMLEKECKDDVDKAMPD
jgi:hypothetical protein